MSTITDIIRKEIENLSTDATRTNGLENLKKSFL